MGIPRGTARLLLDEARRRPFGGRLLELGRMAVYVTDDELVRWAGEQGVELRAIEPLAYSHQPELARLGCLDDKSFFRRLGFDEVESSDVTDWEGADRILDLNQPVPGELRGRYDAVFEAGTIQHVFHLPQVLANIWALLKPGGRVIHGMAPSSNHVDHGFYMFSPTLFHDFYTANGWRIESEFFFEFFPFWHRGRFHSDRWRVRPYTPGALDAVAYGGFGARQVALFVVATRLAGATGDRIPQQSCFARLPAPASGDARGPAGAFERAVDRLLVPAKQLKQRLRRLLPRRLPKPIRRY